MGLSLVLPFLISEGALAAPLRKGVWQNDSAILFDAKTFINKTGDGSGSFVYAKDSKGVDIPTSDNNNIYCVKDGDKIFVQLGQTYSDFSTNYGIPFYVIRDINDAHDRANYDVYARLLVNNNGAVLTQTQFNSKKGSESVPISYYIQCRKTQAEEPIELTNASVSTDAYAWKWKNEIDSTNGKKAWILNSTDPKFPVGSYVWQADTNHDGCKEYIVPSADGTKGKRYHGGGNSAGTPPHCIYDDPPEDITIANATHKDDTTDPGTSPGNPVNPGGSGKASCDAGVLGWFLCPVIRMAVNLYQILSDQVIKLLDLGSLESGSNVFLIWQNMRNLANVLFVLIFLIIIFSNTLSIGIDNYTFKKMLPRLVAAAVLVQFSWVIMTLLFDITAAVGAGIGDLISLAVGSGVPSAGSTPKGFALVGTAFGLLGIGGGAIAAIVLFPELLILALLFTVGALFGIMAVFFTITIRSFLLSILVAIAPLAFVAWILPNTESYFKTWWKTLIRLLLMYPIIKAMFAFAEVGGLLTVGSNFSNLHNGLDKAMAGVMAALLPIVAFYATTKVFTWAGGAMSLFSNAVNKRARSAQARIAKSNVRRDAKVGLTNRVANFKAGGGLKVPLSSSPILNSDSRLGRAAAGAARIATLTSKNNATRGRNTAAKAAGEAMALEGWTADDYKMQMGQKTYYDSQTADLKKKVQSGELTQAEADLKQSKLKASRDRTEKYWGSSSRSLAAQQNLTSNGLVDDSTRQNIIDRFGKDQFAQQLWTNSAATARNSNPQLMFTSLESDAAGKPVIDRAGLKSHLAKQNQATWASFSEPAIQSMADNGILDEFANASSSNAELLLSLRSNEGGPSIGAAQQAIIAGAGTHKDDAGVIHNPGSVNRAIDAVAASRAAARATVGTPAGSTTTTTTTAGGVSGSAASAWAPPSGGLPVGSTVPSIGGVTPVATPVPTASGKVASVGGSSSGGVLGGVLGSSGSSGGGGSYSPGVTASAVSSTPGNPGANPNTSRITPPSSVGWTPTASGSGLVIPPSSGAPAPTVSGPSAPSPEELAERVERSVFDATAAARKAADAGAAAAAATSTPTGASSGTTTDYAPGSGISNPDIDVKVEAPSSATVLPSTAGAVPFSAGAPASTGNSSATGSPAAGMANPAPALATPPSSKPVAGPTNMPTSEPNSGPAAASPTLDINSTELPSRPSLGEIIRPTVASPDETPPADPPTTP